MKNLCIRDYIPFSTTIILSITYKNIRKALDDGNIGFGVLVDLQKAFATVDHQTLLAKLNHYGICGVSNGWFKSYLSNRNQYASINGFDSSLTTPFFKNNQKFKQSPQKSLIC